MLKIAVKSKPFMIQSLLLSIVFLFALQNTHAALNLELTQGTESAIPIAIVPFANETNNLPGGQTLSALVSGDLQNSGQFRIKSLGARVPKPSTSNDINVTYWRKQGVDDVLVGSVKHLLGGRYEVRFQLMSLFNQTGRGKTRRPSGTVLIDQTFTASSGGLRKLAHHISDQVYQQLTGVRGIFSTRIAYVLVQKKPGRGTQYTLEVADEDGFNPQPLLSSSLPIMSPAWAPNGKQIAYVSFENHRAAIYLQNLANAKRRVVSQYPGINGAPAFSPDGKTMALVLTRTGYPKIYQLNLSNNRLTRLTSGYSIDTEPAFAPDGKSLLFTSNRGGTPQIYRYYFKDRRIERMTFNGNYNARASFLPSGQGIVMMNRETGLFGVAEQNLDSGQVDLLTQTGFDESPSVAPNGKMVLYATQYAGRSVLGMISTDGRIKVRLPAREGNVQEPAWSPFLN